MGDKQMAVISKAPKQSHKTVVRFTDTLVPCFVGRGLPGFWVLSLFFLAIVKSGIEKNC
jgi:hypothetical protein